MPKHESKLTRELITEPLRRHFKERIRVTKIPGSSFNMGLPDVDICLKGTSIVIEVKKWDNPYPTDLQLANLKDNAKAGGLGLLMVIQKDRRVLVRAANEFMDYELEWVYHDLIEAINAVPAELPFEKPMRGAKSAASLPKYIKKKTARP